MRPLEEHAAGAGCKRFNSQKSEAEVFGRFSTWDVFVNFGKNLKMLRNARLSKYHFGTRDNRKNGTRTYSIWECALTKCPALSNWQCRLKGDLFQSCEVIRQQDVENVKVAGDLFQSCEVIHRDKNRNTVVTEATCLFLSGLKYKGSNDLLLHHIERFKQN